MLWTVPPLWKDGEAWILGGGPSLPRQFDVPEDIISQVMAGRAPASLYSPYLEAIYNKHVIGINNVYKMGNWFQVLFFGDCGWYVVHRIPLAALPMLKITCCARFSSKPEKESNGIKFLARDPKRFGISDNPSQVAWNGNSGCAAISVAANFGVKRIILVGFDMSLDANKISHWFGSHHMQNKRRPVPPFLRHMQGFPQIAEDAKRRGIEILNASPTSAITVFPKITVKEALNESSCVDEVECTVGSL